MKLLRRLSDDAGAECGESSKRPGRDLRWLREEARKKTAMTGAEE